MATMACRSSPKEESQVQINQQIPPATPPHTGLDYVLFRATCLDKFPFPFQK